jgi:TPR repeat protein
MPLLYSHLGSHYISTDKPDRPADPEKAMKWWNLAVEAGSGAAAKKLGDLYLNRKILRLADADSGFLPNQLVTLHGLSNAALNGALGVVVDPAAQSPDVPERLMIRLILAQQETMQKHEKYFKEGIKVKVVNMTRLTNVKDFGKAISYYKKAIELACDDDSGPESMVELAKLFEEGQGLEKNEEEAFKLLNMAADAGFQPAFPRLAMCYFSGAGVQQDYARCLDLVTASSSLGESKFVLSCMYFEGRAVEKDEKKAVELLRESAQTCSMAMLSLGSLHLSGEHVELDEAQAFSYFKQASDLDLGTCNMTRLLHSDLFSSTIFSRVLVSSCSSTLRPHALSRHWL